MNLNSFLENVSQFLDKSQILQDPKDVKFFSLDRTKDFTPNGSLVLFPKTTQEVQKIILFANDYKIPLVPSGGRTGYSGGAVATNGEVIVSLSKMNRILDLDPTVPSIQCEAGVITKHVQEEALKHGYYFPVDFASSSSSLIGGNVATNAGGIRVIRYGAMRNWVLGLEVVTGRGEILSISGNLIKNNTGYDLKQLFIGSEGTLGIITKVILQLTKVPASTVIYLMAFKDLFHVIECLKLARKMLPDILCFEVFDSQCLGLVCSKHQMSYPYQNVKYESYYWNVLIEVELLNHQDKEDIPYLDFIDALSNLEPLDILYSTNESTKKHFFRYREDISEAVAMSGKFHKNDISIPINKMIYFNERIHEIVKNHYKDYQLFLFGHLGDGNIHVNLLTSLDKNDEEFKKEMRSFDEHLYDLIYHLKGSISAEHGIGLLKKPFLRYSRSKEEIQYMKYIKQIFDPNSIMNPGKIFDV